MADSKAKNRKAKDVKTTKIAKSTKVIKKTSGARKTIKRTEVNFKVKVNGREAQRPVRKFRIATGLILLPSIVGLASTLITGSAMMAFGKLNQPPLAPPAWLFPVAWTILYILMGVALYLVYRLNPKTKDEQRLQTAELIVYFVQLFFNFMWTILFFGLELRWFAFGWLMVMWLMILALIWMCAKNCKAAAWCLVPYILWCTFASYLNIMIAILN